MGSTLSAELGDNSLKEEVEYYGMTAVYQLRCPDEANPLVELNVSNFGIGDIGVEYNAGALSGAQYLRSLDLGYNRIGPQGAKYLCDILSNSVCGRETLWELRLSGNPLGREGCRYVCDWLESCYETCGLKSLYLYQCDLDDECALMLANTLQVQRSITSLNLDMNKFTKKTAIMFAQMLTNNETLAKLTFVSPSNAGTFPEAAMASIGEALARNAKAVAHREQVAEVKAKKAERRRQQDEEQRQQRDALLAEERRRVESELKHIEDQKRFEDEEARLREAKEAEAAARRSAFAAQSQQQRHAALEKAIQGAYSWRDKLTGYGTVQKEWRSGFTIMKTEPGQVGGSPTVSAEAPRRLRACWCDPEDATAPYGKTLHYHCKWEETKADLSGEEVARPKKGDTVTSGYQGCKGSGHICSTVGFYTKARPDLSAPHFFASPHPGASKAIQSE